MKKYNLGSFIINVIILIVVIWFCKTNRSGLSTIVTSSDTTIVINNYYDTTINKMTVSNITNPVQVYEITKDKKDSGLCDSVRVYEPLIKNDTIEIFNKLFVQGRLLNYDISYKWKLPMKTEIFTTITNDIIKPQKGIFGGINISSEKYGSSLPIGLQTGYLSKNGNIYYYSYNLNNIHSVSIGKIIKLRNGGN